MIEAGLNVVSSLVILEEQTDDEYFASVVKEIRADVEGRPAALPGAGAPSEDLQPPLRLDGRGGRGRRHSRPASSTASRFQIEKDDADQAPRQGRDDVPDDGADLRDPRPDRPADVPGAGLREHLRAARRQAADAHAVRRQPRRTCCEATGSSSSQLVLPDDLGPSADSSARSRAASSGTGSSSRCR